MVDLDGRGGRCKNLPSGMMAAEDPRLTVHIGDAVVFGGGQHTFAGSQRLGPIEAGPAVHLYTKEFYDLVDRS